MSTMELALSTLFCLHKAFEEALRDIADAGISNIEIVDAGRHTLDENRVDMLLDLKTEQGLSYSVHAPFTDTNIAADDPFIREAIIERLRRSMNWASRLDTQAFVFHPGNSTPAERVSPGLAWANNLRSVEALMGLAGGLEVHAMIENVPEPFHYVMKSAEDFGRFFDEYEGDIQMVLDVAHANVRGEIGTFIGIFGNRIGHVHVSDNQGDADTHLPIGEGYIDWEKTIQALRRTGYEGWITVESYSEIPESLRLLRELL
ncbi:MAG TPA: sugar phosphate isomerase/epimerase [Patescibacteria group bacterium]|nr:sugar phosphate isomerase/epimerase [Patescibacteria group bacterium]